MRVLVGDDTAVQTRAEQSRIRTTRQPQCTVEVVSDSGEGAQKCGQTFGAVSAKMGNGVWTVEIIPAEIQPPPRSPAGASGNRIRIGEGVVTNWGDRTNVAIAFNEQVLLARHRLDAIEEDAILLVENMWATHKDEDIRAEWAAAMDELGQANYRIIEVPMEEECLTIVENARKGKNMFALGILCWIFDRDMEITREQIAHAFRKKDPEITERNHELLELGYSWADSHLDVRIDVTPGLSPENTLVMNGNQAIAYGAVAAGMDLAAMYPITPATSVSHQLGEMFYKFGGVVHQAEDEIAAVGVALGASYSGKVAFTITSGPGLALKTEFLGLSVMSEIPLVLVNVQRGGPSTGLPTKVEQSDLLAALFGQPGDAPHVVMAPATIEECFHSMITARRIAETFRTLVMVLTDANLATGVQPFPRPTLDPAWQGSLPDMSPVPEGKAPYDWDEETGLSRRFIPGTPGGMHTLTGLAHDENSKVAYASAINQKSSAMRSRKMAVLQSTLRPPVVHGPESGDLLIVGWGSTKGAIEEAVDRAREEGLSASSLHLRFLSPLEPGLKGIFGRFKKVMTVEINYSDDPDMPYITDENRRRGQLAWLLRAQTLVDVDCWTRVLGEPLQPGAIHDVIRANVSKGGAA
ncbi:MAG: 2-oxoacid:acceptor oxidoreductase subunit alpha [Gemmatimonadetes bacterium]|nr:2-oxoacid:acceptor oxidoreductase subunit alpha [Gemmatimonadota bacterium]NNK48731.1 2-oxoacid:acceptor oxidoreductase subunit alpha [Gemmatimonadota bacterium]